MATLAGIVLLMLLLYSVLRDGLSRLNLAFFENAPSRIAARAGIKPALFGTLWVVGLTGIMAVPVGVAAAIYLEEFAPKNRWTNLIQLNTANLSGVPSIVYGLLGLAVFVPLLTSAQQSGKNVMAGALTMTLLILPTVIITTQEALRAVPNSLREASYGLGATQWQTIRQQVLPAATPGILTGVILSISRAIGETAPLIAIGAVVYISFVPHSVNDSFTALPIQIYNWASSPQTAFQQASAAAIIVLLAVLLTLNSLAIFLRYRLQRKP